MIYEDYFYNPDLVLVLLVVLVGVISYGVLTKLRFGEEQRGIALAISIVVALLSFRYGGDVSIWLTGLGIGMGLLVVGVAVAILLIFFKFLRASVGR